MNKRWIIAALLGTVALGVIIANVQEWPPKKLKPGTSLGSISGDALLAIEAAEPEIAKQSLDLSKYNIEVDEMDDTIAVTLEDKVIRPECMNSSGCLGSRGYRPSFSIILARDSLRVITAHFVR